MTTIPYSSASERNQQPILDQLGSVFIEAETVLEIGSGTGQHAVFFTRHAKKLCWQPTDRAENLPGLEAQFKAAANRQILAPLKLDVLTDRWPRMSYGAIFSANTAHIMPWVAVQAMFAGVALRLKDGAKFCLYGPFNVMGAFTSAGNAQFDASLRAQNPQMGIRDMGDIETLANAHQLVLSKETPMPANNFILIFEKRMAG